MFKTALVSILTLSSVHAIECRLVNNQGHQPISLSGKKLSVFWSQEYAGTDLVKEELDNIPWAKRVNVSVFDSGFEKEFINISQTTKVDSSFIIRNRKMTAHHGTSVANIINGNNSYGVSNKVDYLGLRNVKYSAMYGSEFNRYEKIKKYPKIISNSYGWQNTERTRELSLMAKERGILWFLASGNDYPLEISEVENNSGALLVGSHAPSGLQSSFSQVSENVITLAGGDDYQASIDGKGEHTNFGGTSGATPLVAGSIVNIASLIPNITYEQTKKLIKKTNLPSFETNKNYTYSPGIFNAYKAYRVAKRIALACLYNIDSKDSDCVSKQLDNDENFDFRDQVQILPSKDDILNSELSCEQRQKEFKRLRKISLLLDSPQIWGELDSIYTKIGYTKNSEYYSNLKNRFRLSHTVISQMERGALSAINDERYFEAYFRYQDYFSDDYQVQLSKALVLDKKISKYWIVHFLTELKSPLLPSVRSYLERSLIGANLELTDYINQVLSRY
ncbi:S8/S53 family peptidase [Halobacteriovorax sp.]|uniref:S8/S53 family peptidase n=1 Tax=Halobacteriovorax sp. TaxID=2020862 RepID=UPI0035647817